MTNLDWKNFESAVFSAALAALQKLMDRQTGTFYAVVFHEFYAEAGEVMSLPLLAANAVEQLADGNDSKWSSADWKWPDIRFANTELKKQHRALEKAIAQEAEDIWQERYQRYIQAFVNVARKLTAQLKQHPRAGKEFSVLVFVEEDSEEEIGILQRCLTPSKFKKLFPYLHSQQESGSKLAANTPHNQLAEYRKDIREFQKQILALGDAAIPMLTEMLEDPKQGWAAARLLAELGIPDPQAISALRRRAATGDPLSYHDMGALVLLGDLPFVLELANSPKTAKHAVHGISYLTSCLANESRREIPLDYRPMESLLDNSKLRKIAAEKLKDIGPIRIVPRDVEEALRGLSSKHAAIRRHAVVALGEKGLGKKLGERILPALAERLQDPDADVRRIAILSLSYWKQAAKPWAPEVRKLVKDDDELVASYAQHYLPQIAGK